MSSKRTRPWFVSDQVCDEYLDSLQNREPPTSDDGPSRLNRLRALFGGDFQMIKALKVVRSIIVNLGTMLFASYLASLGGNPTVIAVMAFSLLAGYNGLEVGDYLALVQAYKEVQQERENQ